MHLRSIAAERFIFNFDAMKVETQIAQSIAAALQSLYGIAVAPDTLQLTKTKKEFEGNLTLVVFPF